MTLEETIEEYEKVAYFDWFTDEQMEVAQRCKQIAAWLRILKKAKFEYDEAWRILTHPTPDVTYVDRSRAQLILDTFRNSLGRME